MSLQQSRERFSFILPGYIAGPMGDADVSQTETLEGIPTEFCAYLSCFNVAVYAYIHVLFKTHPV